MAQVELETTTGTGQSDAAAYRLAKQLGIWESLSGRYSILDVHEALVAGLPSRSMVKAIPEGISVQLLLPAFGMSLRTFMRIKAEPTRRLGVEQSSRVWRFAELIDKASDVLGGRDLAVEWMREPAMALENRRPIELLATSVGAQLVEDVIERMRYGVYQ